MKDSPRRRRRLVPGYSGLKAASCDILVDRVPEEAEDEDIQQEEMFLEEEMKTEVIPGPTRSVSLAMFQKTHEVGAEDTLIHRCFFLDSKNFFWIHRYFLIQRYFLI